MSRGSGAKFVGQNTGFSKFVVRHTLDVFGEKQMSPYTTFKLNSLLHSTLTGKDERTP